ncbi:hypothetical protein D9619_001133 [Psilocybe cf. subviscida]|uniref:Protein kinase domain-containing protein n=1 Tax=Psilocybe cf. subviscida TaxID=2480587 RepID=A0A8H5F3X4_9AGAR|nr:hypothetical protein D9619_001133 [Psilocybe cf. subviscida]
MSMAHLIIPHVSHPILCLGKTVAQITAELAPIPVIYPLVESLCGIIQLCENVAHNRCALFEYSILICPIVAPILSVLVPRAKRPFVYCTRCADAPILAVLAFSFSPYIYHLFPNILENAARQLRDRCHTLVLALREYQEKNASLTSGNIILARNAVHDRLIDIQTKMNGWAHLGKVRSFVQQDDIAKDIAACHADITDTINAFQLQSHFEIHEWMAEFKRNQELDHRQLTESLSQLQSGQEILQEKVDVTQQQIQQMMAMLQMALGQNKQQAAKVHSGLSANLYTLQSEFHELLPDFHLQSGEVQRVGEYPVRGTATMDVYEGLYLGKEKVAVKVLRSLKFDETSKRRFTREAKHWGEVWKHDRGRHIVPFYGYCQMDGGPFPCMISPWQQNGDALAYVKANDRSVDYKKFIVHIAQGVQVLHNIGLVHGELRALNVLVNDRGYPLLSDFGLSKIIQEESVGIPLTQSSMMADSCRYFAPEAFQEDGILSKATDIYSLAMTILEVLTHQQPYRNVKHHFEAGRRASQGTHPERPTEAEIVRRGLDEKLWTLLTRAWCVDPAGRPRVDAFCEL